MQTPSQLHQQSPAKSPKEVYFTQKLFGKPTKNRTLDPSMFQLLTWSNQSSIEASDFKKKQRFVDPESAYLSMISRQPWISESQESHLNFYANSIPVNEEVFRQVENYIQSHESKQNQQKGGKPSIKMTNKNQNEWSEQQVHPKSSQNNVNYGQKHKVPQQSHKVNNYMASNAQKQNSNNNKKDLVKRPASAKNISHMNSPKAQTWKKQIPQTYEELQIQQEKRAKKRDQITEEEQEKLIQKFKQTTRWIPNSSFMTYFGKPPFENYGRGNTKPIDGGLVYGTYLYSHSVHPHRGVNSPSHVQTYPVALMKAKSMGKLVPTQPKTVCKYLENKMNNEKERQYDCSGAIEAMKNTFSPLEIETPDLHSVEKFGASKLRSSSKTKFYTENCQEPPQNQSNTKQSKKRL